MFARFYGRVLLAMALAGVLIQVLVVPRLQPRMAQAVLQQNGPSLTRVAADLAEARARGEDLGAAVTRASARYPLGLHLVARADEPLDPASLARLDRGEVVARNDRRRGTMLAAIPRPGPGPGPGPGSGSDWLVATGPIADIRPLAEGRGIMALGLILLAMWLGVYLSARPMARRLSAVAQVADRFGRGDRSARAEPGARDELGSLAREFNAMAERVERLIASREELLRMISHELRTPMQRIHFTLEKVREATDAAARDHTLQRAEVDLQEIDDLIDELLTYTRLEHVAPASGAVPLGPLLAELRASFEDRDPGAELVVPEVDGVDGMAVRGEARLLRRALSNLIANGLRHARSRVEVVAAAAGELVCIDVDDDGPGVPEAHREQVFEPFFRLDEAPGRGFGLGLAIVRRIAERSGGRIEALRSGLGGARFRLSLRQHHPDHAAR